MNPTGATLIGVPKDIHYLSPSMDFTYEQVSSEGTRFTPRIEAEPGGFFGLVGPVLERVIRRQMRANLETLKDLLEARGRP